MIEGVVYLKKKDEVLIKVKSPKILPYCVYRDLKSYSDSLIDHQVTLFIRADDQELSLCELAKYLKAYSEDNDMAFKSALPTIKDDQIIIKYDQQKHYDTDGPYFDDLRHYLKDIGYERTIDFAYTEDKEAKEVTIKASDVVVDKPKVVVEPERKWRKSRKFDTSTYMVIRIDDLSEGIDKVAIDGEIFKVDEVTTKTGKTIQTVYLKDEDNAILIKIFESAYFDKEKLKANKEGRWIRVYGQYRYDDFSKDHVFFAEAIEDIYPKIVIEDGAIEKRVELHAHTDKSEMDGICSADELVKAAFKMGHRAIAITDHYDVQSFPDAQAAYYACKKNDPERDFKVLYGCEMAMVDQRVNIVYNKDDSDIADAHYVVFDVETSGLSNKYDYIIEFGAVTMYKGNVESRLDMFIKPPVEISSFTTALTNIKNSDLQNAKTFAECKDEILAYIKDKVLVAHNGIFDYGFLNGELARLGEGPLPNIVVDTLPLAREMFKERKRFALGNVANFYHVDYSKSDAHRADYDAEVLAQVYNLMLKDLKARGIKTFKELDDIQDDTAYTRMKHPYHVTMLAKNKKGLKDLFKLVSIAHTETIAVFGKGGGEEVAAEPRIFRDTLNSMREDLLIGSACLNGEIFTLASEKSQEELEEAMRFYDYIEVQPLENYRLLYEASDQLTYDRLLDVIRNIIATAKKLNKPVVATGDSHYVRKDEKILRDVYIGTQSIGGGRHPLYIRDDTKRMTIASPAQHFRNTEEMLEAFEWLEDEDLIKEIVITSPNKIADMCDIIDPIHSKLYTPVIEGSDDKLRDIVYKTAKERYGDPLDEKISARLKRELDAIIGNGYGVIYYVSHLLVKHSNEDGYLVGSRGSVGSSLVATMSGITEVNPLPPHYVCPHCKHLEWIDDPGCLSGYNLEDKVCPVCGHTMKGDGQDIPFETFLGFNGDKVPDIDLNFSGEYQEKAHLFLREIFGEDHVFRAGTISTVAEKTAFGYAKGYYEGRQIPLSSVSSAQIQRLASGCEGVKRTTGQHPGGIIVIPDYMDVYDFTPVQYPANDPTATWRTTHFDFHKIHDNVLKFDILGHVDPTAMRLLQNISGIDPKSIPMNDPKVMSLFSSAKELNIKEDIYDEPTGACGLPEFGTRFVRGILELTKPSTFSDLVQISGLSHGTDVWNNNAKDLVEEGIALKDVIGCRDDIMVTMLKYGLPSKMSFDIMEKVRKGKGLTEEYEKAMIEHDVPKWYIDSCKKIKYMFPKAHAVAYVIMAVRIAWFKVYYPRHYYVSYFSLRCDAYDIDIMTKDIRTIKSYMDHLQTKMFSNDPANKASKKEKDLYDTLEICYEMKARGYDLVKIDINRSLATDFLVDPTNDTDIIPPFMVIDGLGENVAKSIIEARNEKPFISKEDLMKRTLLSKTLLKRFEDLGILDGLDDTDQVSLF